MLQRQDSLISKRKTIRSEARVQSRKPAKDMMKHSSPTQELLSKRIEISYEQYENLSKKIR
jgi:hypothetical protein